MEASGYPGTLLLVFLALSTPIALIRPFTGFLIAVFFTAAANAEAFTATRTDLLGPFFNANDAILLVALVAFARHLPKRDWRMPVPTVVLSIFLVLGIGFVQATIQRDGVEYDVLRALRWAVTLPTYFIIAAAFANSPHRARMVLLAVFFGSVASAIQHIMFVHGVSALSPNTGVAIAEIRTISFRSPGLWLLLAAIIFWPRIQGVPLWLAMAGMALFGISLVLNQTRSIWLSSLVTLPLLFALFPSIDKNRAWKIPLRILGGIAVLALVSGFFIPQIDVIDLLAQRTATLTDDHNRLESTITRSIALERELEEWSSGSWLLGRGLFYFGPMYFEPVLGHMTVAWGHLGHVTTLAQLGILGLLVYSLYLPLIVIRSARRLWLSPDHLLRYWAIVAASCAISTWFLFFMSDSFLSPHASEGIIFGVAWQLAKYCSTHRQNPTPGTTHLLKPFGKVVEG